MSAVEPLGYAILDPTGNITALVETPVDPARQPETAAALMARHPQVEQVGFLSPPAEEAVRGTLRMAGGEFCGNATMSAAALAFLDDSPDAGEGPRRVLFRVSGAADPVEVRLERETGDSVRAGVKMPPALRIETRPFVYETKRGDLPVVWMEGISHIVIEPGSPFWSLLRDRSAAEEAVRNWCQELGADGLGLMFLDASGARLTPLVYVPGSGTVFWENSCASGTSAAGMVLAARAGEKVALSLTEPGGVLRVESDPAGGTWLYGRARLVGRYVLPRDER